MDDPCDARNCALPATHIFVGNSKHYCRQHYKQIIRRAARKDQTTFVVSDIKTDLEYGEQAGKRVQLRFGKLQNSFWLQAAHGLPTRRDDEAIRERQIMNIRGLHPDDVRAIADALREFADQIDREVG